MVNFRQFLWGAMNQYAKRNFWKVFGYPVTISIDQYWLRYRRDGIGGRIIRAYPDACWRGKPDVRDGEETESELAKAWGELEDGTAALSYLHRLDRLARVGHYAILVLGFDDGERLSQPVEGEAELVYLAPYSERSAKIIDWERDQLNPRFGLPTMYEVDPIQDKQSTSTRRMSRLSFRVHWTRVIHVAENVDEDDVFGEPALRPIWNYLIDLEKVLGSGAETYWLNARGGLSVEASENANLDADAIADMKQQMDDYENELRRTLALQGAKVSAINIAMADPRSNVDVNMQMIGGTTGIPQRILTGTERGELSSTEDANSWESRVQERIGDHCDPHILRPFIRRMIETGNLPEPSNELVTDWPDNSAMSPAKQAEVAKNRIEAASSWANGFADRVLSREEAREMIGLDPELEDTQEPTDADTLGADIPAADLGGGIDKPQDTALNGAQIGAIKELAEAVALGQMPADTAAQIVMVGFPLIDEATARAIMDPLTNFTVDDVQ